MFRRSVVNSYICASRAAKVNLVVPRSFATHEQVRDKEWEKAKDDSRPITERAEHFVKSGKECLQAQVEKVTTNEPSHQAGGDKNANDMFSKEAGVSGDRQLEWNATNDPTLKGKKGNQLNPDSISDRHQQNENKADAMNGENKKKGLTTKQPVK